MLHLQNRQSGGRRAAHTLSPPSAHTCCPGRRGYALQSRADRHLNRLPCCCELVLIYILVKHAACRWLHGINVGKDTSNCAMVAMTRAKSKVPHPSTFASVFAGMTTMTGSLHDRLDSSIQSLHEYRHKYRLEHFLWCWLGFTQVQAPIHSHIFKYLLECFYT